MLVILGFIGQEQLAAVEDLVPAAEGSCHREVSALPVYHTLEAALAATAVEPIVDDAVFGDHQGQTAVHDGFAVHGFGQVANLCHPLFKGQHHGGQPKPLILSDALGVVDAQTEVTSAAIVVPLRHSDAG